MLPMQAGVRSAAAVLLRALEQAAPAAVLFPVLREAALAGHGMPSLRAPGCSTPCTAHLDPALHHAGHECVSKPAVQSPLGCRAQLALIEVAHLHKTYVVEVLALRGWHRPGAAN